MAVNRKVGGVSNARGRRGVQERLPELPGEMEDTRRVWYNASHFQQTVRASVLVDVAGLLRGGWKIQRECGALVDAVALDRERAVHLVGGGCA